MYPALSTSWLLAVAVSACALLLVCLATGWAAGIPWVIAGLAAEELVAFVLQGSAVDLRSPVMGVGLFLVSELAYWSLELRIAGRDEAGIHARRVVLLAVLSALALVAAAFPLLGALTVLQAGWLVNVAGVAAAVVALALVTGLVWRARLFARS